jgi:hypothetical protein
MWIAGGDLARLRALNDRIKADPFAATDVSPFAAMAAPSRSLTGGSTPLRTAAYTTTWGTTRRHGVCEKRVEDVCSLLMRARCRAYLGMGLPIFRG